MTIHIVQHGFIGDGLSHYFMETVGWKALFEERQLRHFIYTNQGVSDNLRQQLNLIPTFDTHPDRNLIIEPALRLLGNFIEKGKRFEQSLNALLLNGLSRDDLVIFPYCHEPELLGISEWLASLPDNKKPRVACLIHQISFDLQINDNNAINLDWSYYQYAAYKIEQATDLNRFAIFTMCNQRANRVLKQVITLPCHNVPHDMYYQHDVDLTMTPDDCKYHVAVLGQYRQEKGSDFLAGVFSQLIAQRPDIRILLQVDRPAIFAEVEQWLTPINNNGNITVFKGQMDMDQYAQAMQQSCLILMPYLWRRYAVRGSGLLTESIAYGKPCIVPDNTVLSDTLTEYNCAGAIFKQHTEQGIAEATLLAYDNRYQLSEQARAFAPTWRKTHSMAGCFDAINQLLAR